MKDIFDSYLEVAFEEKDIHYFRVEKRNWYEYNFKELVPTNKECRILEIGPGRGELMETLKEWGYSNVKGIDISASVVDFCRANELDCELVDDSTIWLENVQEKFEFIILLDVLEHLEKKEVIPFLKACHSALEGHGKILIQVPNLQSPEGYLHRYNDITHEIGFVQHTLEQCLSTSGFKHWTCFPFEEYVTDDEQEKMMKQVRAFYWRMTTVYRNLTHNLQPEILTPEFFCIAGKVPLSLNVSNKIQLENNVLQNNELKAFLSRYGIHIELIEKSLHAFEAVSEWENEKQQLEERIIESEKCCESLKERLIDTEKCCESFKERLIDIEEQNKTFAAQMEENTSLIGRIPRWIFKKGITGNGKN